MSNVSHVTITEIRRLLHSLANGLMPLTGTISLMRLGKIPADDAHLEKLEKVLDSLCNTISEARETLITPALEAAKQEPVSSVFEITYLSRCNLDTRSASEVREILDDIQRTATKHNAQSGIGGFLVYSDSYFLQRLEGPEQAVKALMTNILLDTRHSKVTILSKGFLQQANFRQWRAMYCYDAEQDAELVDMMEHIIDAPPSSFQSNGALSVLNILIDNMEKRAML